MCAQVNQKSHAGGNLAGDVVWIGETVRRRAGPWTPAVHQLLRHVERMGFRGAPRALGTDDGGRECPSFVLGSVVHARTLDDADLARVGRLIRNFHTTVAAFVPFADAQGRATGRDPLERRSAGHLL
jgi:hypothetical protein